MKRSIAVCALLVSTSVALAKGTDVDVDVDVIKETFPADQAKITKIMNDILEAAQKKELDRLDAFHAYGPKFTKFEDDELPRQDSETSKKGERDGIAGVKSFSGKIENLKVDVFGTAAVVTCILKYDVDTGKEKMSGRDRSTIVFAKAGGTWKIVHEHHSPLKNPS